MGRRRQYLHCVPRQLSAVQYPFADDPTREMVDTWCGTSRLWDTGKPYDSPKLATCLKCAQAIGKHKLAKLASGLCLERREAPLGYDKSTYDVYIDGTLRAHVGIANGWGKKWYLAKVGLPAAQLHWTNGRHGGVVSGSVADYFQAQHWKDDPVFWPIHFAARDAMAAAALRYFERYGIAGLPTAEEALAAEAKRKEDQAAEAVAREEAQRVRAIERERRETEEQERRTTARDALASLERRIDLSNLELAGLAAVRTLLKMESANEGA